MFYNDVDINRCRSALCSIVQQFNNRLERETYKENAIHYDWSDPYSMSVDDVRKCVYEMEFRLTPTNLFSYWDGSPFEEIDEQALEVAWWRIKELRKAWKGIRIAATKQGYDIPDDYNQLVETQYKKVQHALDNYVEGTHVDPKNF